MNSYFIQCLCILAICGFILSVSPQKYKWIILFFFLLLIYLLSISFDDRCNRIKVYTFSSNIPGPTIVAVAGSHGNEPGGSEGLNHLIRELKDGKLRVKKGTLIVLPELNPCGLKLGMRYLPHELFKLNVPNSDLNRNYNSEGGACTISKKVQQLIQQADYVYDGHEGYNYTQLYPTSMGSGIYPSSSQKAIELANHLTNSINSSELMKDKEDYKKFITRSNWDLVNGSLRKYCQELNIPYILVETTGQNNIQPISTRADQHYYLCKEMCTLLGIF